MPIIDYHCHLNQQDIYENKKFNNLTEIWLYGDHYKWRAMRANGVEEKFITGGEGVNDYDRFFAWAKTVPMTIGNPLYHWSHLELQLLFGIHELINEKNAPLIWEKANAKLQGHGFIHKANVQVVCTTDDPADSLEYHNKLKKEVDLGFQVLPTFRWDKALEINRGTYLPWINKLGEVTHKSITDYDGLLSTLASRAAFFHSIDGRISDHALDYVPFVETTQEEAAVIFAKALQAHSVSLVVEQK